MACTRVFNRTSTTKLLKELGWPSLKTRREYFSLVLLYKMTNGLTPAYLQSLLPPKQGHHSRSPGRRSFNFIPIRVNKVKYIYSFQSKAILQQHVKYGRTSFEFLGFLGNRMLNTEVLPKCHEDLITLET